MIILFEENETMFQSLGFGLLKDARSCYVSETINDAFELELVYPKTGALFSQIKLNRIIFTKPNPYSEPQPFRIYSISKPINGVITVKAVHISYDMNGLVVAPISGTSAKQTLDKIQNGSLTQHNFKLYTDLVSTKSFTTNNYFNMRALLLGSEDSVLEKYKGEISFDKFNVYINERRGSNKGAQVRYAKNMKDINHEVNYERLYNGVYPFYHQETTETTATTSSDGFKQVYIVGTKPFQDGWLSYNADGEPYHPVDESPVQIATDGDYFGKVYTWNATTQRYSERIYNEMVNLIECVTGAIGITDKPSWIYIDVSALPTIVVRANEAGYFKLVTDTEWNYRAKGEIVYQGAITNAGDSLLLYYSEVIPTVTEAKESTTTSVTHVELKDKIIYLDTPAAKEMKHDRIMCLDLTSEFDEAPDEDKLKLKADEYIEKNKIGQYKYETTVSFVDLANTTEGTTCEKMETIELGDTVKVVYEGLDIDLELRVITTKYNAILDRYENIELGEKPDKLSANSVQSGDNVSSLTNDVGYADITTVNKLIAKTITADLIQAKNAKLSKAQIEELQTARIKITGMIEATQFELDKLVAKMLIADNAEIKHVLEAGEIKVKGDITVTSGEITLISKENGTVFNVDREGNVEANSVKITGGELNINDTFSVTPEGILTAHGAEISGNVEITSGSITLGNNFKVTEDGTISAFAGEIAGFTISKDTVGYNIVGRIHCGVESIDDPDHDGVYLATDGIRLGPRFYVTPDGVLHADSAIISGEIEATSGSIAGFDILEDAIQKGTTGSRVIVSPGRSLTLFNVTKQWSFLAGASFTTSFDVDTYTDAKFAVSNDGTVYASALNIRGGSIDIRNSNNTTSFSVDSNGNVTASSVTITGGAINIHNANYETSFVVDSTGRVTASDLNITGGSMVISDNGQVQFRITPNGQVTASNLHINGGEITLGNTGSYTLNSLSDLQIHYTILENLSGVESGDYDEVHIHLVLNSLREERLPVNCGSLREGTMVPVFEVEYFETEGEYQDPDCYDTYWYIGTYIYEGTEYDMWVKVEDPDWGDDSFNSEYRKLLLCTKVVTQNTASGAYFRVDDQGNLTATSANIKGKIEASEGNIGGFTIGTNSIYSDFTVNSDHSKKYGVYVGTDLIRLGNDSTRNYYYPSASTTFIMPPTTSGANTIDITDSSNPTDCYNGCKFKLTVTADSSHIRVARFRPCTALGTVISEAKTIDVTIPKGADTVYVNLYHPAPTNSNGQMHIYFKVHDYNGYGISGCRLTLDIYPGFVATCEGNVTMVNATVKGTIIAADGNIGGFTIDSNSIRLGTLGSDGSVWMCAGSSTYASIAGSGSTNGWTFAAGSKFGVKTDGTVYAEASNFKNININGGNLNMNNIIIGSTTSSDYNVNGIVYNMLPSDYNTFVAFGSTTRRGNVWTGITHVAKNASVSIEAINNNDSANAYDMGGITIYASRLFSDMSSTYKGFTAGITISTSVYANNSYGMPADSTTFYIGYIHKESTSGATMVGYPKDVWCSTGAVRMSGGYPLTLGAGWSYYDSDIGEIMNHDLASNKGTVLAMWCCRCYVGGDQWYQVPKYFGSSVLAVVTGRYHGGSLGNYHYPSFYKIENGYVYVGNDDSGTTCDVIIIYRIDY